MIKLKNDEYSLLKIFVATLLTPSAGWGQSLWDQTGLSGKVTITLPEGYGYKTAFPVDLRGEPMGKPLVIRGVQFSISLSAYAPASFILGS
jgi:hypothetical protein